MSTCCNTNVTFFESTLVCKRCYKEQDLESNPESINVIDIPGQIEATRHLLSVATDIMNSTNERVYE